MSMAQQNPVPRPEHPRPQFYRGSWLNLNGLWDFDFDFGDSGKEQGWQDRTDYQRQIMVPFCPESRLSGVGYTDFMEAVWYHRILDVTEAQLQGRLLLHFGAVDYHCEVFVNGEPAGIHDGGYTSFCCDITELVSAGENHLTVYAADHLRTGRQPGGKQSSRFASRGCFYTRTTGIWQTVWVEYVPRTYLTSVEIIPDPDNSCAHIRAFVNLPQDGMSLQGEAWLEGEIAGAQSVAVTGTCTSFTLPLDRTSLWEPASPALYDLKLTLSGEKGNCDQVASYFGLRKVEVSGGAILLNGKPVFQRLVLDQGFYPDGIYTAPTEEALKRDIELSMDLGFNGARLHEKIFEERYLYWADKLGYLVWGEFPNWGLDISSAEALCTVLPEWLEAVKRDFSHPSIVGWCPFNETWDYDGRKQNDRVLSGIYLATKAVDPTRPVIDTSGNYHVLTDIYDIHDYEQDPEKFAEFHGAGCEPYDNYPKRQQYRGEAYFISEYGGTWWNAEEAAEHARALAAGEIQETETEEDDESTGWGYGKRPRTQEEAAGRIAGLTKVLLGNPRMCAFCYTQLTDVEQEQNGLYTYAREPKFSPEMYHVIREGFKTPAAIENM